MKRSDLRLMMDKLIYSSSVLSMIVDISSDAMEGWGVRVLMHSFILTVLSIAVETPVMLYLMVVS